jgi:hypothetical protein
MFIKARSLVKTTLIDLVDLTILLNREKNLLIVSLRFISQVLILIYRLILRFENNGVILILSSILALSKLCSLVWLVDLVNLDLLEVLLVKIFNFVALRIALDLFRVMIQNGLFWYGGVIFIIHSISLDPVDPAIDVVQLGIQFVQDHYLGCGRLYVLVFYTV